MNGQERPTAQRMVSYAKGTHYPEPYFDQGDGRWRCRVCLHRVNRYTYRCALSFRHYWRDRQQGTAHANR